MFICGSITAVIPGSCFTVISTHVPPIGHDSFSRRQPAADNPLVSSKTSISTFALVTLVTIASEQRRPIGVVRLHVTADKVQTQFDRNWNQSIVHVLSNQPTHNWRTRDVKRPRYRRWPVPIPRADRVTWPPLNRLVKKKNPGIP